ncbi:MAG: lytic transglycosylase domain-containing protein [Actinomycetota bacterium]
MTHRWAASLAVLTAFAAVASACAGEDVTTGTGLEGYAVVDSTSSTASSIAAVAPDSTEPDAPSVPTLASSTSTTEAPAPTVPDDQPTSAAELADALSAAELAVRDTDLDPEQRAAWGRRQQWLYRILAVRPEAEVDTVLGAVDPEIATAVATNWQARVELNVLLLQHGIPDYLPAWRIVEPAPADELLAYYQDAGAATGVPWEVLAAINLVETRMGRIRGISTAGAVGPMQFLPTTWAECCEGDPTQDRDAIRGAAEYLIDRGAATDLDRAIWGYNNSDRYVAAVQAYASVLAENPEAYSGYHAWEVYYRSSAGLLRLPVGYEELESVDATQWWADNPEHRVLGAD